MQLTLDDIEHKVGAATHLYPLSLRLQPGTVTVLLGATQAGKTTLMRLMAGLDVPSAGRVTVDGEDVTGRPVRDRNVAMVYQQFINYPSMTVADNIASPLKIRGGLDRAAIAERVQALAAKLHIEPFLQRLPEFDSGLLQRLQAAASRGNVLRYVGSVDAQGKAEVGLVELPKSHPFANIALTDNIVRFQTARYDQNPLIVQGPGAGPAVTAAGVFADLLRVCAYLGAKL